MKKPFAQFNKFTLIKKIAHGGMAEIFLACIGSITHAQRFVVLKKIMSSHSHNKEFTKMFKNEGKIVANLSHSNIASVYEFGLEKDQHFICMEYISGRHLRQLLQKQYSKKTKLSIPHIAHIIKNICMGLDYAHNYTDKLTGQSMNIIHRDISPQNIMISFNGEIKLIDFGIAKASTNSEATRVGVLKGKLEYMSPEQVRGEELNHQTDIFSLGSILWELLAGRKLFTAADELSIIKKIKECNPPDLKKIDSKIPDRIIEITNKALHFNKNIRYNSIADMSNDITVFLNIEYPNFTPTNFNSFIKDLYIDEILEERDFLKSSASALTDQQQNTMLRNTSSAVYEQTATKSSTFVGYDPAEENTRYTHPEYTSSEDTGTLQTKTDALQPTEKTSDITDSRTTHINFDYNKKPSVNRQPKEAITNTRLQDDDPLEKTKLPIKKESNTPLFRKKEKQNTQEEDSDTDSQYKPYVSQTDLYTSTLRRRVIRRRAKSRSHWMFVSLLLVAGAGGFLMWHPKAERYRAGWVRPAGKYLQSVWNTYMEPAPVYEKSKVEGRTPASLTKDASKGKPIHGKSENSKSAIQLIQPPPVLQKTIFLDTKPSGATIYVNDRATDQVTPSRVAIPMSGKKIVLTVEKRGFYTHKYSIHPHKAKSVLILKLKKIKSQEEENEVVIME